MTDVPLHSTITSTPTFEITSTPRVTPNPTQILNSAFETVDDQFRNVLQGNIAFFKPDQIEKNRTAIIELILSPTESQEELTTQIVEKGNFVTSTVDPNILIAPSGEMVTIKTDQVEITPRMKAVLKSQNPEAFIISEMHDNAEQVISTVVPTTWRWSVTAKIEGSQTLELVIYQLIKYDEKEFWHEVETYKADIIVDVTVSNRLKSLDWKWVAGFIVTLIGAIIGILKWQDERTKRTMKSPRMESKPKKETKRR